MPRPIRAVINLDAVRHNLAVAREHAGTAKTLGVAKANAYGHGLLRVLPALDACDGLALLEIDAACRLRDVGYTKPIVLLEGFFDEHDLRLIVKRQLTPVVHTSSQLDLLAATPLTQPIDVWLKMNSGMNRLGLAAAQYPRALARLRTQGNVANIVLMTHFASSDDGVGVSEQLSAFTRACGAQPNPRSLANSAALIDHPRTRAEWVRPGIMLYGASPFADRSATDLSLRPAMQLQSAVIAVQQVSAGASVGYGMAFKAATDMRIGIVACGYADGYPRHAPTGTPVVVDGVRTRTVGRVSMDMIYVDLTSIPQARNGSAVQLWGDMIAVDEVATASGTVGYELLCSLAPRVPVEVLDTERPPLAGGPAN